MYAAYSRFTNAGIHRRNAALLAVELAAKREAARQAREAEEARRAEFAKLRAAEEEVAKLRAIVFGTEPATGKLALGTYRKIERLACKVFGFTPTEIRSKRRSRQVVFARQFICYWCARTTTLSLPQIGRMMGGRDHTTILHGRDAYPAKRARMGRNLRPAR
jgi:chromosomal replication initiation ATPase DnaA